MKFTALIILIVIQLFWYNANADTEVSPLTYHKSGISI